MGQYLQLGICHRITVDKERLQKFGLTENDVAAKLSEKMDMSLFTCHEHEEKIQFMLKESVVLEQLHDFLQGQFSMYPAKEDQEQFNSTLMKISNMQSMQEIVELAEGKALRYFQSSDIYEHIKAGPWDRMRLTLSLFVFFLEGKIIMEEYIYFLGYLENLVRANSQLTIVGAFRVVIQ